MLRLENKTKDRLPNWPWEEIATAILGKKYDLSLTFIGDTFSKSLNSRYRGKIKPTNVLAFPLNKRLGDIFINLRQVKREAASFGRSKREQVLFLFIHGLLHLKGFAHGSTMEQKERLFFKKFSV